MRHIKELRKSKTNHTVFYFKEVLPALSWDDVFLNFNETVELKTPFKLLENFGVVLHTNKIPVVEELLRIFSSLDPLVPCTAHTYISFTKYSHSFGNHKDNADVLYWQAIGSSVWDVQDFGTYKLDVNNFIFVPRGVYHNVTPLEPRVGISFGLEYD